jgi:hypothetical protein
MSAGTMSKNAADLIQIAILMAGFDKAELQRRIIRHPADRKINERTVCNWLQEMRNEWVPE